MKKLIFSFALTLVLAVFTIHVDTNSNIPLQLDTKNAYATGCTLCSASSSECHRIIIGNQVHIFHGDASPCPSEDE